ncbi:unnamed protein product [Fraxinus pennsylvanica]|uniref:Uncharacterized protein n=1 Tax=Fraxinus pennsylvanica TaxID=56036 RepID=A0AAD2AA29_9LAMI|nr:unnamed protein product [Fraxinus pennsylvanica]
MTFLNLGRLLPPRKVWKVLTSKFQLRLHKSKAIKKQKTRPRKASKKLSWLKPTFSIQRKKFKRKKPATLGYQCHSLCHLQQITTPVYVDKLFIEPVSVFKEQEVDESSENKEKCSSSSLKKSGVSDYNQKSNNLTEEDKHTADDMWESLVLASPQMEGINERAEEFIAKFRADMQQQEILARRL